jgi:hypothetical protein
MIQKYAAGTISVSASAEGLRKRLREAIASEVCRAVPLMIDACGCDRNEVVRVHVRHGVRARVHVRVRVRARSSAQSPV